MRSIPFVLVVGMLAALGGCGKKAVRPPAKPATVPATPPPAPPPAPAREAAPAVSEYERLSQMSVDELDRLGLFTEVHFDFDKADIREADRTLLAKNAEVLKRLDFLGVTVEGHCDERGTVEYNLALGERRGKAVYDYLVSLGVTPARLRTVSYGKEAPLCRDSNEDCWSRNRRARLKVTGKAAGR